MANNAPNRDVIGKLKADDLKQFQQLQQDMRDIQHDLQETLQKRDLINKQDNLFLRVLKAEYGFEMGKMTIDVTDGSIIRQAQPDDSNEKKKPADS